MESRYWKELLSATAKELAWKKNPKRLTFRRCEIIERDVILGFFIIRRLIELSRASKRTIDFRFDVFSCPFNGRQMSPIDRIGIEKSYDIENEQPLTKKMAYIANQFIHSTLFLITYDNTRNWDSFFVVSDFDKSNCVWRVPAKQVECGFRVASNDYLENFTYKFDTKTNSYKIKPI
jgi:hypothetical protein